MGKEAAKDFLRVKGVLEVAGSDSKYVLQSVHKVRTMGFCGPWGGCLRANRMIFIGPGMKSRRVALLRELMSCIAKPLRFSVGAQVLVRVPQDEKEEEDCRHQHSHHDVTCNDCDGHAHGLVWREGTVLAHWHKQNAYRIRLLNGPIIFLQQDEDCLIRSHEV